MQIARLSDIALVRSGFPFRAKVKAISDGGVPVVQPKDIVEGGMLEPCGVVRTKILHLKADYLLHAGDTLLALRGRIAAADYSGRPSAMCVASGSLLVLRPKVEQLLPGYLTVFFNSEYGRACVTRIVAQTTATFVSRSDLESLEIPVPDVDRQIRLIAMARNVARYADLTRRRTTLLNSLVSYHTHV